MSEISPLSHLLLLILINQRAHVCPTHRQVPWYVFSSWRRRSATHCELLLWKLWNNVLIYSESKEKLGISFKKPKSSLISEEQRLDHFMNTFSFPTKLKHNISACQIQESFSIFLVKFDSKIKQSEKNEWNDFPAQS